jgi:CubicO group peptidase (beta-lactamase class C family)
MIIKNVQHIFLSTTIFLMIAGCAQKKENKVSAIEKTELRYEIPKPAALAENEKLKIENEAALFYDTLLKATGFNGGMIVAKGGNIVYQKYRGSVNLDGVDSITENTPLHIASVSKTFTAMAILKLQEAGKLSINDTLTKYFPQFNYAGVTIKTLLDHRSGLPNYLYFMEKAGWNTDSVMQNKDVLDWLINKKGIIKDIAPADTKFTYCNTNFALLALIIEKVTGQTYPAFMKENIFDPAGMKNTFVHHHNDGKIRSKSFDWRGREIPDNFLDEVYGDKNIYSTPQDLLKWDRILSAHLYLSAASLDSAYAPYSNEKPGQKNYGFGWRMNIYPDGKKIIFHNGWWHGNNAAFIRLIPEDATIIILSNRFTRNVYKAKYLVNAFNHYFDFETEESENLVPATIPDKFQTQPGFQPKSIRKNRPNPFQDKNR